MTRRKLRTGAVSVPDDILEAKVMRARAEREQQEAERKGPAIARLTGFLTERTRANHFGESIQITYTRRGHA